MDEVWTVMSRQVSLAKLMGLLLNETDLRLLQHFASRPRGSSSESLKELAQTLGVSTVSARRSVKRLEDAGFVGVTYRHMGNGGQLSNRYRITAKGREFLFHAS